MGPEKMRRVLAYAIEMPDTLNLPLSTVEVPVWGAYDGWNIYANTPQGSICVVWEPDIRWDQCGMVIEMMRKKKWSADVTCEMMGGSVWVTYWRLDEDRKRVGHTTAAESTFPAAVSLAAYRALEAADV